MNIVVNNPEKFQTNLSVHFFNSRQKNRLQRPTDCFSSIQEGVTYSAIKFFKSIPPHFINLFKRSNYKVEEISVLHKM